MQLKNLGIGILKNSANFVEKNWHLLFCLFLLGACTSSLAKKYHVEKQNNKILEQRIEELKEKIEYMKSYDLTKLTLDYRINEIIDIYNLGHKQTQNFKRITKKLTNRFGEEKINSKLKNKNFKLDPEIYKKLKEWEEKGKEYGKKKQNPYLDPKNGFWTERSFNESLLFMAYYEPLIDQIIKKYNLTNPKAKYILTSIAKIETNLGRYLGKDKAFNTLMSLYVYYPKTRTRRFAKRQLKALMKIDNKLDSFAPSSIMGAIGYCQAIPKSIEYHKIYNIFSWEEALSFKAKFLEEAGLDWNPERAVFKYNRSRWYVEAVLEHANVLYEKAKTGEINKLQEKLDGPLILTEKEGFFKILEEKLLKSNDPEFIRLMNFYHVLDSI